MNKSKLLFVDDDAAILAALRDALRNQRRRWDMWFAADEQAARHVLKTLEPDAIVLNGHMADAVGLRLLKDIRAAEGAESIPVVMLTDDDDRALKRRALHLGATDLLTRPVRREELIARLRSVLALRRRQVEVERLNEVLERKVRQRTAQLERSRLDVIWRLAKVGEYRDDGAGDHIIRVGRYCRILAEQLGLAPEKTEQIHLAAPLHDIGKVGIPDAILLKSGRLEPAEWAVLETHCVIGSEILLQQPKGLPVDSETPSENHVVRMAASIALTHHERWDGTGYPLALRGATIPLESRLVAVADVYDALRSARPYKPALTHGKTMEIMAEQQGRHFDPDVFDAFGQKADTFEAVRDEYDDQEPADQKIAGARPEVCGTDKGGNA